MDAGASLTLRVAEYSPVYHDTPDHADLMHEMTIGVVSERVPRSGELMRDRARPTDPPRPAPVSEHFEASEFAGAVTPRRTSCTSPVLTFSHFGGPETNLTLRFYVLCSHGLFRTFLDVRVVPGDPAPAPLIVSRPGGSAALESVPGAVNGSCWAVVSRHPKNGAVTLRRPGVPDVPCDELRGAVIYRHFRGAHPTDRFTLRLRLPSGSTKYVQKSGIDVRVSSDGNRPPQATHRSSLWTQRVTDDSTPFNQLQFRLTNLPPGLSLVSTFGGYRIPSGSQFLQEDLLTGGIALEASRDVNGSITFQVYDEDGAWTTAEASVAIRNWKLYNLMSASAKTGLLLREGAASPLQGFGGLSDLQPPPKVSITLANGPILGSILVGGVQSSHFTVDDLIESRVVYRNTRPGYKDFLKLNVEGCGVLLYPIFVVPEDRRPPALGRLKEFVVGTNGRLVLTPLTVIDLDSQPDEISYQLSSAKYGKLYLRRMGSPEEEETTSWTQRDVSEGRVVYQLADRPAGGGSDTLVLTLQDRAIPPNVSPPQHLQIKILRDTEPPKLVVNSPLHATPGTPALVNSLQASDVWSPAQLTYTPRPADGGLFTTGDGSILHVFTQSMVDKSQVYFTFPSSKLDVLEVPFSISDGDGNTLHDQVLKVFPIKDSQYQSRPPDEVIGVIYVPEGGAVELSEDILGVEDDPDQDFSVEEQPKWGRILVEDVPQTRFNTSSLFLGDVAYEHDGTETGRTKEFDRFTLRVANSTRRIGIEVVIEPVDDSPPQVDVKRLVSVDEGGQTTITKENVAVWDDDTDNKDVICDVILPPTCGTVYPSPFTVHQLEAGSVVYSQTEHARMEPMEDTFIISCHDVNPLRKHSGRLTVAIHPLNDEEPSMESKNITTNFAQLSQIIKVSDMDTPDTSLTLGIVEPPKTGAIKTKLNNTSNFTASSLPDLYYEGAEQPDEFILGLSDGKFYVTHKIHVLLQKKFDPLQINKGIEVGILKEAIITKSDLYSKSDNEDAKKISYTLKNPPMFGSLLKGKKELGMGDKFTQEEVNERMMMYKHSDKTSLMDVFVLDVSDGHRTVYDKNVFVTIKGNLTSLKVESKNFVVSPGGKGLLNDKVLVITTRGRKSSVDIGVVSPPSEEGFFEYKDKVGDAIRTFSYEEVRAGKIVFADVSGRCRSEIVQLEVSDGKYTSFHSLTVSVSKDLPGRTKLVLVKNAPINTLSEKLFLEKPGAVISQEVLLAREENELAARTASGVAYNVTLPPKYGQIYNLNKNSSVHTFTQDEVTSGSIVYLLTTGTSHTFGDSFLLDLSNRSGGSSLKGVQVTVEWSLVSFKSSLFVFDETDKDVKIELQRTGSLGIAASIGLRIDGGNVTSDDVTLETTEVKFVKGQSQATADLKIKNDLLYERMETLTLSLTNPRGTLVGSPSSATVFIFDDEDEDILTTPPGALRTLDTWPENLPQKREEREDLRCSSSEGTGFRFVKSSYEVGEEDGVVDAEVLRNGDPSAAVHLVCYTELSSSASIDDVRPRPKNSTSAVFFAPGDLRKNCSVLIKNDDRFEGREEFTLLLKCVEGLTKLGSKSSTKIIISDDEDEEEVRFENEHYFVKEPRGAPDSRLSLVIPVVRGGDASSATSINVTSRDGTALNGVDFNAKPTVLNFNSNIRTQNYEVEILGDNIIEIREFFTLRLELASGTTRKSHETVVHISDTLDIGGLMFPRPPQIISLKNFQKIDAPVQKHPIQGYPLVCLSVCDQQHRFYSKFVEWCSAYNITTEYRWQIEDLNGDMKDIQEPLFFAKSTLKTLDSVYFRGGYRVRCGVVPGVGGGAEGKLSFSSPVAISRRQGLCPPPKDNMIGAEPFMSHIEYNDVNGTRGLRISVTMAHHDGLFPALSTKKLTSFKEMLASYPMRPLVHKCSNLVTSSERLTRNGFIEEGTKDSKEDFLEPHEHSGTLRGNETVRIYRHLDLRSCMWHFEAVFTLGEALEVCGATVKTDAEKDEASVLLELPLYLSYFTHSLLGWQRTDSSTNMRLKFTYKTSTISKGDIGEMIEEKVEGHLVATNMFIAANGSLVVYFTTKPKFAGFFLYEVPGQ
ncbi:hypothetical protein GE061_017315 [Apolygus lucorum]|uniref:Calx-beta domain-containing protein n=1 Tax=Apolygus lucorum TaxID=248454 RepID=A0A8S9XAI8_APOLU|nr:hypothetical protein GE061_017315 [Apolygus lucorum]